MHLWLKSLALTHSYSWYTKRKKIANLSTHLKKKPHFSRTL